MSKKSINFVIFAAPLFTLLLNLTGCGPFPDLRTRLTADISPPAFLQLQVIDSRHVNLQFNEPIITTGDEIRLAPALTVSQSQCTEDTLYLTTEDQLPGQEYELEFFLEDEQGNGTNLYILFYGFNPRVPQLLLNEFITQGSKNHPDLLEIAALTSGNLAGVTVYEGLSQDYIQCFVFPPCEVDAGDFILLHFKAQQIPSEIDEILAKDQSGGLDASLTALDFWVREGSGLSGNNGVLSLYSSPGGELQDGVFYSNRQRSSDEKYEGFGSERTRTLARELAVAGGWVGAEEILYPEDGVNPEESTSTRSLCRDATGTDTNSKTDWHIVPTRMSSFGAENSNEVYQ